MVILQRSDLRKLRENHGGKKIVICSGTFDLTHAGHVLFFEDCKNLGDILVVCVGDDKTTRKYKGSTRPILNESVRLKMVDSLKPVDYTLLDIPPQDGEYGKNTLSVLFPIFEVLQPDIWAVNEDAFDIPHRLEIAQNYGMELKVLKRTCPDSFEHISTSKILEKIKMFG
ncbi:MAG TPA: adenylyltransferase/cytidyltransferase family protein [Candidatus Nanoarchaeia archaeon]|nr:adenylyltransferase/cytidyltransferase family protein [Candidatus Nanoarchaeia archaeon]